MNSPSDIPSLKLTLPNITQPDVLRYAVTKTLKGLGCRDVGVANRASALQHLGVDAAAKGAFKVRCLFVYLVEEVYKTVAIVIFGKSKVQLTKTVLVYVEGVLASDSSLHH